MPRWIPIFIAIILGIALGLAYGWIIDPVQYTDTTPDTLRIDFRTDYVLMAAEAYQNEQDPELAARRLAILGSEPPDQIVNQVYEFARQTSYPSEDIVLLQELAVAMQTWQPEPGVSTP